jgi:hypothetical protein
MSRPLKLLNNHIDKRFAAIKEVLTLIEKHFSALNSDLYLLDSIEDHIRRLDTSEKQQLLDMIIRIRLQSLVSKL